MTDADIRFYFDPVCPFAWMTSKWVRMVAAQRDYTVDWRFISLRLINSGIDYDSHFPAGYEEGHASGLRLLRVAARVRAEHGRAAVGSFYEAVSGEIFDSPGAAELTPATRGSRAFVEPLLARAGLPAGLADALDDTRWDDEIRAEGDEALSLTGRDVGTPILHFSPPEGTAFFGPVISRLPARRTRSGSGTTSPAWPASPASPSSSAACASGRNCAASAWSPARPGQRRTGTPAAANRRLSLRPLRCRARWHRALVANSCPATLVWKRRSKSAWVMASSAPKCSTPALLTSRSRPPSSDAAAPTSSWACAASLTSAGKADAAHPLSRSSPTRASAAARSDRWLTATAAPWEASRRTIAAPIPRLPPSPWPPVPFRRSH